MSTKYYVPQRPTRRLPCVVLALAMAWFGITARAQTNLADLNVVRSPATGVASFVTARNAGAIPVRIPAGSATAEPMDFLDQYGDLFGITAPAEQLVESDQTSDSLGHTHTTLTQVHRGIPVFSGVLKVHQNAAGMFTAANGDFYPIASKVSPDPIIDAEAAERIARTILLAGEPVISQSELVFVDPGWYGDPPVGTRLAYHIILEDTWAAVREAFFIDAHNGVILDHWSMLHSAKLRAIHDGQGGFNLPGPIARLEGQVATGDSDIDAAYDYYGDTYDYFFRAFGRDGIDDDGMTMVATTHSTAPFCPNAFWSGSLRQMVFCDGTVTDDIVGHELTHGVTEFSANLIYQNQSGQLNESYSDVFGEMIDLFNGDAAFAGTPGGSPSWPTHETGPGEDEPNNLRSACSSSPSNADGVRWMLGEDAEAFGGAIRDMWDPPCEGDPDRANSPLQICHTGDVGGVHSGSGVPNHAFAILTDGKAFNGFVIDGIGPIKAGAVWYRALTTYLTVASDFDDAYFALNQAAADLVGTEPNDPRTGAPSGDPFTAGDAEQVDFALRAVEMHTPGLCGDGAVLNTEPAPVCPGSETIFADDFENGVNDWTVTSAGPGGTYDWIQTADLPTGRTGTAWFVDDPDSDCFGPIVTARHSLISPEIVLPADVNFPTLSFMHSVQTETAWDGGNLSISVNGAGFQLIPHASFLYNPYNIVPMLGPPSTNPLGGSSAFSGRGGEWGTSLVHIGAFASGGDSVRIRFDFGKDICAGAIGWYVDDFELYDCNIEDCNNNGIPDEDELGGGPQVDVVIQQAPNRSAVVSDADPGFFQRNVCAESFAVAHTKSIETIRIWGIYATGNDVSSNDFTVRFHESTNGFPGTTVAAINSVPFSLSGTGTFAFGLPIWRVTLTFASPVVLDPGVYFVQIYNDTVDSEDMFFWVSSHYLGAPGYVASSSAPGGAWSFGAYYDLAIEILAGVTGGDCNSNAIPDDCEVDCDGNSRPDDCDIAGCPPGDISCSDCNANGLLDSCETTDCNENGVPDDCDVVSGVSEDCNGDAVPDECGTDCNANGTSDECDFLDGTLTDNNGNGIADECETVFVNATSGGGTHDGTTWATAFLGLQEALTLAADSGGIVQEVWVVAGTYKPAPAGGDREETFTIPDGIKVYGGFTGGETFLGQRDPVANPTILSGDLSGDDGPNFANYLDNSFHVVTISNSDGSHAATLLDGFTIRGGNANGIPPGFVGGGMYIEGGEATIANCTLIENRASVGGGMHVQNGNPTLKNCTFIENFADSAGGMSTTGQGAPVLTDCLFDRNEGGGMGNSDGSAPVLLRTEFRENISNASGAGMHNSNDANASLTHCLFVDNVSAFGDGGAIYSRDGSNIVAVHCTFTNNSALSRGGAMYNFNNNPSVVNCAFIGNQVTDLFSDGGGLYTSVGSATVTNCTFNANFAAGSGGGLYHSGSGSTVTLRNSILWGNADGGSGLQDAQVFLASGSAAVDYSCIQGLTGALGGTGNISSDPRFSDTAAGDLRLESDSPCSDAADNLADTDANTAGVQALPDTDLDGNFRFFDNAAAPDTGNGTSPIVDMGAWEFQECTSPIISIEPTNQGGCIGSSATFEVTAIGTQVIGYQWRAGGSNIAGANGASYTVAPITPDDAALYDVVVSNECGSATSVTAALIIETEVPTIVLHPQTQGGCVGEVVTLTVLGESIGPVAYQWRKNLAILPGASGESYTIDGFGIDDAGSYDVLVTNGCGSTATDPAILSIGAAPAVSDHPTDATTCGGGVAVFTVTTFGTEPLSYQWRRDGENIVDASESTLAIDPATIGDAGAYDVVITNPCGSDTSDAATLTVTPPVLGDFDGDCAVTIEDYRVFQNDCLSRDHTWPEFTPPAEECLSLDADADGDVDLLDFGNLQAVFGE